MPGAAGHRMGEMDDLPQMESGVAAHSNGDMVNPEVPEADSRREVAVR